MAVHAGHHRFGSGQGRIALLTSRDGLAAQAGHDLTIEIGTWSAELDVADDLSAASDVTVRFDLNSLIVRDGTGGALPLTDRDRREIAATARKVLGADRHPQATFTAPRFEPRPDGGGTLTGTLTLASVSRPVSLDVSKSGRDAYRATGSVLQTDFGIKPYRAFLGALKVSDAVRVAVDVTFPEPAGGSGGTEGTP